MSLWSPSRPERTVAVSSALRTVGSLLGFFARMTFPMSPISILSRCL